jgi:hypothetical protein
MREIRLSGLTRREERMVIGNYASRPAFSTSSLLVIRVTLTHEKRGCD